MAWRSHRRAMMTGRRRPPRVVGRGAARRSYTYSGSLVVSALPRHYHFRCLLGGSASTASCGAHAANLLFRESGTTVPFRFPVRWATGSRLASRVVHSAAWGGPGRASLATDVTHPTPAWAAARGPRRRPCASRVVATRGRPRVARLGHCHCAAGQKSGANRGPSRTGRGHWTVRGVGSGVAPRARPVPRCFHGNCLAACIAALRPIGRAALACRGSFGRFSLDGASARVARYPPCSRRRDPGRRRRRRRRPHARPRRQLAERGTRRRPEDANCKSSRPPRRNRWNRGGIGNQVTDCGDRDFMQPPVRCGPRAARCPTVASVAALHRVARPRVQYRRRVGRRPPALCRQRVAVRRGASRRGAHVQSRRAHDRGL